MEAALDYLQANVTQTGQQVAEKADALLTNNVWFHSSFGTETTKMTSRECRRHSQNRGRNTAAEQRRLELELQRTMLDVKLEKLSKKELQRKLSISSMNSMKDESSVASVQSQQTAPTVGSSSKFDSLGCHFCNTKDTVIEKQAREIQELREELNHLQGIPCQIVFNQPHYPHDELSAGSGVTNHVAPDMNIEAQEYNLAVLNGKDKAAYAVHNVENLDWTIDQAGELRDGLYTGPVDSMNKPNGKQGRMRFDNGDMFVGDFQSGDMHGTGRFTWTTSGHVYEGQFWHNMRHGRGCHIAPSKYQYVGAYRFDRPHGPGTQILLPSNVVVHKGDWENGRPRIEMRNGNMRFEV
eukprot:CAMPEP_0194049456 /NCGR_PEP_ID=MMETSP0009_2-20130614/30687_1 /TAXON_ID=210454 /ORGANISM="Grammatophora oceanica, Strain CCMP 410" /LENGTH=351 /DNA_ID=CAMNT_0038695619 /DNA_START=87 /DNA_END=1142 /DNA_ORIENTATION=+